MNSDSEPSKVSIWRAARAVLWKDWRGEWRVRASLNAIALFSIAAPIALSFSVAGQKLGPETLAGLLWTTLLFAALVGLGRAFVKEEEAGTSALLRLSCPAEAVLWGKTGFNFSLLLATQIGALPLFVVMLQARIDKPALLVAALLLGDLGLAVSSSILGAMAAQTRSRGALFAAISVPILLPLLVAAASVTASSFGAAGDWKPGLETLAAYDVVILAASWLLFEFVWA